MNKKNDYKDKISLNIASNYMAIAVNSMAVLWLTPFMLSKLGLSVYSLVPLTTSIVKYIGFFTSAVNNSMGRFVSLHINSDEIDKAKTYYNTAFLGLLCLGLILLVIILPASVSLPLLLEIPDGFDDQAIQFFRLVVCATVISAIASPFQVSPFVCHRFDLINIGNIGSRLVQLSVILFCFTYFQPSLLHVGWSYVASGVFILILSIYLSRYLTPELKLNRSFFDRGALREISNMGVWTLIDSFGTLLYLSTDLLIVNIFLGPEAGGRYALVVQWVLLLALCTNALSSVFSPVAYETAAKGEKTKLTSYTKQVIKYIGMLMALPIGILCGLSSSILERWVGSSFVDLHLLMWLLIFPCIINSSLMPLFAINRAYNKVKVPALATLLGGTMNVVISILLVKFTDLGIYGVAISTAVCFMGRNLLFTVVYTASILSIKYSELYLRLLPGIFLAFVVFAFGLSADLMYDIATIPMLIITAILLTAIYTVFFIALLDKNERMQIVSLLPMNKHG